MLRPVFEDDAEQMANASVEERLRESELRVAFLEKLLVAKNSALKSALGVGDEPLDDDYDGEETSPTESGSDHRFLGVRRSEIGKVDFLEAQRNPILSFLRSLSKPPSPRKTQKGTMILPQTEKLALKSDKWWRF